MRRLVRFLRDEKGELIIEKLIAAGAVILLMGALIVTLGGLSKSSARVSGDRAEARQLEQLAYTIRRESTDAAALFVPANDVNGVSNADGHAVGAYFRDGQSHQPTFVEYVCTGDCAIGATHAGGSVQRYTFTTWSNPAATLKAEGSPITGVGMGASYLLASELATKGPYAQIFADRFAAAGISAPPDRLINVGYPGIQTGNRITVVKLENRVNAYELHLLPLAIPTVNNGVVIGYFTPTPNALCVFTSSCGLTTAVFAGNNAPAQQMNGSEINYPTTSAYGETDTCAGIASIAAITASGPNPSWRITPVAGNRLGGSCTVTITDVTKQTGSITVSVAGNSAVSQGTCPIQPAGTFLYTDSSTIPPTDHYASGASTCATPTPVPTPMPTPTPVPTPTPTPFGGAVTPTPTPTPPPATPTPFITPPPPPPFSATACADIISWMTAYAGNYRGDGNPFPPMDPANRTTIPNPAYPDFNPLKLRGIVYTLSNYSTPNPQGPVYQSTQSWKETWDLQTQGYTFPIHAFAVTFNSFDNNNPKYGCTAY